MVKILSINAGSSSLKWKLFDMPSERQVAEGATDILRQSTVKIKYGTDQVYESTTPIRNYREAVSNLLSHLQSLGLVNRLDEITGIGHRVVAGGEIFPHLSSLTIGCWPKFGRCGITRHCTIPSKPIASIFSVR